MIVHDLIRIIEEIAPPHYACDWDNTGFLIGHRDAEVTGIYIALDVTEKVIEDAKAKGCNFLLTHHPIIFRPVKSITDRDSIGSRLLSMAENGIACYAAHTSYDAAPGRMADLVAKRLGLKKTVGIEASFEDGFIGKVGELQNEVTVDELCAIVKDALDLPYAILYAPDKGDNVTIKKIGVLPGSGGGEITLARRLGAEAYITGDISHHVALDATQDGIVIIDAGHYGTEWVFINDMSHEVEKRLHEDIPVIKAPVSFPGSIR